METVQQNPFILCAWPSFADQPYINNYRVYDDRVGETTRFFHRPDHEVQSEFCLGHAFWSLFVVSVLVAALVDVRALTMSMMTAVSQWYWLPQQQPHEVSMLKCYDSVTDGSMSRWSFHTACIDPSLPKDAPCRRNVVVRTYVFFDK